ncbi:MAG: hypothetical protein OXR84_02910 [Magnetovibrio sp.]|nr:hypothetical protein [Magnetovibrio sp.]
MSVAGLAGLLFALTLSAGPAAAATPNCGGKGQKICTTEKATFVKNACPKGSFFDPRKGGECW